VNEETEGDDGWVNVFKWFSLVKLYLSYPRF
jgi:hypothetical protein